MSDQVGRVLGDRYRLVAPVGSGASAMVFLAEDVSLKRQVAVKVLHESLTDDRRFLERFRSEAQTTASLNHRNLLAIHDWGFDEVPYLVTEYLAGGTLQSILDAGTLLTRSQALLVGLEAARALEYAHRRGLVHRDIKPSNLLFDDEGRLRIADFGLARALAESSVTEPEGAVVGTARYAAPEQAQSASVDGRADIYALGLVLAEAVTGAVPLVADTTVGTMMLRVGSSVDVPAELGPLQGTIARCGRLDPDERPDASELAIGLMAAAESLPRPTALPLVPHELDGSLATGEPTDLGYVPDPAPTAATPTAATPAEQAPPAPVGHSLLPEALSPETLSPEALSPDTRVADPVAPAAAASMTQHVGAEAIGADLPSSGTTLDLPADPFAAPTAAPAAPLSAPGTESRPVFAPEASVDVVDMSTSNGASGGEGPAKSARGVAVDGAGASRGSNMAFTALGIGLLVALIAGGWFLWGRSTVQVSTVPEVTGVAFEDLDELVGDSGWNVVRLDDRVPGTDPGEIIGQSPERGSDLAAGDELRVTVSLGEPMTNVPVLVGLTEGEALTELVIAGLALGEVKFVASEEFAEGQIIRADMATRQLMEGSVVPVIVSSGPAPRNIPEGLVGQSVEDVTDQIEALGLGIQLSQEFSNEIEAGIVLAVDPEPGTQEVPIDRSVVIFVSQGPELAIIPNVEGLVLLEAQEILKDDGFLIGGITGPGDLNEATVLRTDPPAGDEARLDEPVDIITRLTE